MGRLIAAKVAHTVAVLLLVSFATAFLVELAPGDPAYAILGDTATPEQVARVHDELNLDDPLPTRYAHWLGDLVRGDLGSSFRTQEAVTDQILDRVLVTIEIGVLALLMALVVSIPIGIYCAYRADGRFDNTWSMIAGTLTGIPAFVMALVLVSIFSLRLRNTPVHFPVSGWTGLDANVADNLWHAFLPALTLALVLIPQYSRIMRADMIATLREDYILAARAKGVPTRRILFRHAFRPSSFSLVTLAGVSVGFMVGGAVIVETLFSIPGLGQLLIQSIQTKDIPSVQGIVMFIAIVYVLVNAALDILYGFLDPRVRVRRA